MSLGIIVALAVFVSAALALLPGRLLKYTYTLYTSCLVSAGSSTRLSSPQSPILPLYSRLQLNIVHAVIASSPYCAVLTIDFFLFLQDTGRNFLSTCTLFAQLGNIQAAVFTRTF